MGNEFNGKGTMCGCGSGGSGGEPADYEDLKNQVATNTADIATNKASISEMQETMSVADEYFYIPLQYSECLILKGAKYIDTGLKMDGGTYLYYKGALPDTTKQAVLVGAYKSNSERTVLKILGQSHKIQSQWAGNVETTEDQVAEMDFTKMIEVGQNNNSTTIYCSNKKATLKNTGFTGIDKDTPLLLFNQTKTGEYNNGALRFVDISNYRVGNIIFDETITFIGARKYRKNDMSFVGYSFIMLYGTMMLRELPLPDGAYFELYEVQ